MVAFAARQESWRAALFEGCEHMVDFLLCSDKQMMLKHFGSGNSAQPVELPSHSGKVRWLPWRAVLSTERHKGLWLFKPMRLRKTAAV
jgi:hypothetical protein